MKRLPPIWRSIWACRCHQCCCTVGMVRLPKATHHLSQSLWSFLQWQLIEAAELANSRSVRAQPLHRHWQTGSFEASIIAKTRVDGALDTIERRGQDLNTTTGRAH